MQELLDDLIQRNRDSIKGGKVADYIPALKNANPNDLGISIIDGRGNVFSSGEYKKRLTIQSISKILALMLAIMDKGEGEVFQKVGMEGIDEPFNSLYKLDFNWVYKPANPMMNAGAIVTTSLIEGKKEEISNRILGILRKITSNNTIDYDQEVYSSEKATGDKNRAIAYLLKSKGIIKGNVESILDAYFKQCSIRVDCVDLAKIGVFLANGGKIPNMEEQLVDERIIRILIAIMTTSGMYNYSGEYAVRVGIPSKSGVSGGLLAVVPRRYGIGVYGPALDGYGNSIGACSLLEDLSKELNLSIFSQND